MGKKKKEIKARDKKPVISNESKEKEYKSSINVRALNRAYEYLFRGLPSGEKALKG